VFDDDLRDAYLRHLGVEREPPSVDALQRLLIAHLDRVPFETMWIALGERYDLDPVGAAERIVHHRRGGYCFLLNDALGELLGTLGYSVSRHVGGVHGAPQPDDAAMTNHLVLVVSDLPDEANPSGRWYVEAGMGDGPATPMALAEGALDQPPYRYALSRIEGIAEWELVYGPPEAPDDPVQRMAFKEAAATMDAFAARHVQLSTSPESGFVRVPTAQRRRVDGITIVRACTFTTAGTIATQPIVIAQRADWFALVADEFGLTFEGVGPAALDRLWRVVVGAHEAHLAHRSAAEANGTVSR
jgi:arylamine N-acetyltransferase